MTIPEIEFRINISDANIVASQLDRLTTNMMRQLRNLGAESVERASGGKPPDGAKGISTITSALNVVATPNFIDRMMSFLRTWASRGKRRTVIIETPAGVKLKFTPDQPISLEQLAAFVQAVTSSSPPATASSNYQHLNHRCQTQLWECLTSYFDASELRTLCFHLSINYEDLPGNNRSDKIITLIEHVERHNLIEKLLEVGSTLRKDIIWDRICTSTGA